MQSVPITTNVVSSIPTHGEMYSMQPYVIKFVSDLSGFLRVLLCPPTINLTDDITEILLKVALNTLTLTLNIIVRTSYFLMML